MLLHISPTIVSRYHAAALLTLDIEPLNLHLKGGSDLRTGRPYPNKCVWVACRKKGHKNFEGILIETPTVVDEFRVTARWAVEPAFVATHQVHYKILDHDFDAASDNMILWLACCKSLGGWESRYPPGMENAVPMVTRPRMEVLSRDRDRRRVSEDILDEQSGWIVCRQETFAMPTLERERILNRIMEDRLPPVSAAFPL